MSKLIAKLQEWTHASKQELIAVTTLLGLTTGAAIVSYYRTVATDDRTRQWLRQLDSLAQLAERTDSVAVRDDEPPAPPNAATDDRPARRNEPKRPPSRPINVNTAPKQELMRLPGIGEAMADRIVAARKERPFGSPDDLLRVQGIGKKKLERLRPYIRTDGQ